MWYQMLQMNELWPGEVSHELVLHRGEQKIHCGCGCGKMYLAETKVLKDVDHTKFIDTEAFMRHLRNGSGITQVSPSQWMEL